MVTGNPGKAAEVAAFFHGTVEIEYVSVDLPEPRSDNVSEIAREKGRYAYGLLKKPVIVDDTGLFIRSLNGFPGPFAAYVQKTLGNPGILTLMHGISDRSASFVTAIAYTDRAETRVFTGILDGMIAIAPHGSHGFGYDPIFEVESQTTLADMSLEEKSRISHRAKALVAFRDWFVGLR